MTVPPVMAFDTWSTNGHLIADAARLGYLPGSVLDVTYGHGTFWSQWRPADLIGVDLDPAKSVSYLRSIDFTDLPFGDDAFDTVVFDPPYKLNGRPSPEEERYGVHEVTRWQDRMELIRLGAAEAARVSSTMVLVKCQDQVCSGQMRWQTDLVTGTIMPLGFRKVDRFDFQSYRPQPAGRTQRHAHRNSSQLLIFTKELEP